MKTSIRLNENDNVIIALTDLTAGTELQTGSGVIVIKEDIARGHKVAACVISEGAEIIKDNFSIGYASEEIAAGAHVHTHNVGSRMGDTTLEYKPVLQEKFDLLMDREVRVYYRKNWNIGIRNELWIIPTVSHVNRTAQRIKKRFMHEVAKLEVDGIHVFEHPHGCFQLGEDLEATRKILQNIALHPNTGGVLVVGLGTESNDIASFQESLGDYDQERIHFMVARDHENEVAEGVKHLHELHNAMKHDYRSTSLLRNLKIGMKYGEFDAMTAVTAAPLFSYFSDYLVKSGGTVALTEIPRMVEASQELVNRLANEEVFQKVAGLAQDFRMPEAYAKTRQGITTLEEKSFGYLKKMGSTPVNDALVYGERLQKSGVNLLESPSNDLVAATALGAAGCHMVLYATSEGTPFGSFVPTVKIATNSKLAKEKPNWVDYDGEQFLASTKEEGVQNFINFVCDIASGKWTRNEYEGYREIAIWQRGETL